LSSSKGLKNEYLQALDKILDAKHGLRKFPFLFVNQSIWFEKLQIA